MVGFTGALIAPTFNIKLLFIAIFFIIYNVPHLYTRVMGIKEGYRSGFNVYKILRIENFLIIRTFYQILGAFSTGLLIGWVILNPVGKDWLNILVFVFSMILAFYFQNYKRVTYLPIILSIILAVIIGVYAVIL